MMHHDSPHPADPGAEYRRRSPPNDAYAFHDRASTARLSTTVAHALADVMGADVTSTETALARCVDSDALDRLFDPVGGGSRLAGHVAFNVRGFQVTAYASGHIVITPPGPRR